MLETGTSGLMSGEGKRVGYLLVPITRPSSTLPNFRRSRAEVTASERSRAAYRWCSEGRPLEGHPSKDRL